MTKKKIYISSTLSEQNIQDMCMTYYDASRSIRTKQKFSEFYNENKASLTTIIKTARFSIGEKSIYDLDNTCADIIAKNEIAYRKTGKTYEDPITNSLSFR